MATKKPTGPHSPVSNVTETAPKVAKAAQAGNTGKDKKVNNARPDGVEEVPGLQLKPAPESAPPIESGVLDIGLASFGGPPPIKTTPGLQLETVHGADNRVQVTATAVYPWRAICSLAITARDGSQWIGTGWFISARTVITAGHCVYIKNSGVPGRDGWVRSITVMPGRNGATKPHGSVVSTVFRSVTGWTNDGNENFDYAAILLPTPLGTTTGWFGYANLPDADIVASVLNVSGYPGDKPAGTMWVDAHRTASVNPQKVYYDIDTLGGQSGAAVFRILPNGQRQAVAIHAYGGATTNSGTRINAQVYANMTSWKT